MVISYMRWEGAGLGGLDESLQLDRFVLDDSKKNSSFATGKNEGKLYAYQDLCKSHFW